MAVNYEKQCHELFTFYEQDKLAECLEQGQRNVRDLPLPSYWRIKTWYILAGAESDWKKAEKWRQKAEILYRSLPKEEMDSRWNKDLRASLDELRDYQAADTPEWFLAKERLDAMFRDEKERRSDRSAEQSIPAPFFSGGETEDRYSEIEFDLEGESPVDSSDDGEDDDDDEDDEDGRTMQSMTIEEMYAYQEAAAAKEDSAKDPAETVKMKEETRLGTEATDATQKDPSARTSTDAVSAKPGIVAGGNEAGVEQPDDLGPQCKQCNQEFSDQQALGSHIVKAQPGEALQAVILKLVDERFNALVEEKHADARKELDRLANAQTKANSLLQETTKARAKLSQEIHKAKAKLDQREARLEHKFNELQDQLIQSFTKLVGLADEHPEVTANQDIARILAQVLKSVEQKAQRMRDIAKSEHDTRAREAAQSEIEALDAEQAFRGEQSAAQHAQLKARHVVEQEQLATQQALSAAQSAARKEVLQGKLIK